MMEKASNRPNESQSHSNVNRAFAVCGGSGSSHAGSAISVASPSPVATTMAGGLPLSSRCSAISHVTCRSGTNTLD